MLFDFDGTLADTFPRVGRLLPRLARELRFRDPGPEEIRDMREMPIGRILSSLGIPGWKVPLVLWRARSLLASDPEPIALFPGVADLLGCLDARGVEWGILTSNSASLVRSTLRRARVPEPGWLEAGLGLAGKTSRLKRLARRLGVPRDGLLLVSDELRDVDASREAGVPMVAVAWGYGSPEALSRTGVAMASNVDALRAMLLDESG